MNLRDLHTQHGATLAPDGIPLQYNDLATEYEQAHHAAVLLDRSHEGRIHLTNISRFELLNRMSTNKLVDMTAGEGRATLFTNDHARIIDRIEVYNLADTLLAITEPGQGPSITNFIQKHIFYGDQVQLADVTTETAHFALHGPQAVAIAKLINPDIHEDTTLAAYQATLGSTPVTLLRRKAVVGTHWAVICAKTDAEQVYVDLLSLGAPLGLIPAGSLTFNTLRIEAGRPARPELNTDYIPMEVGLYDEISFTKGCYTGQEIIARMDSRERIARVMVQLELDNLVQAPADLFLDGRLIGKITSSVQAPNHHVYALGVVKTAVAIPGKLLTAGEATATIVDYAGTQPTFLKPEQNTSA
ncbi:aminomethyl transferase family protein [Phototrophicus methaneseepsis]|uniref:Aminomethyl transferase family protein n=1 Tax=Phototrophicus methaneseepsis TaxID=2710758 RepID=A0A7S8E6Y6_9CHLR|nr:aminomethyl transferase family protein [Phototrophicus methaneseepsis]QPC81516.1 aminomethyl transferase family protein [Phototrophicus methaneseepsis]